MPVVAYLNEMIAGQPADRLAGVGPAGRSRSRRVRAHRRDHRRPEDRRAHPRQPARLRPGDRASAAGLAPGEGDAGRPAAVPRQRADRHRHRARCSSGARVVWPGPAGYRDKALYTRFWQIIEHYRIAAMSAVPTVYGALAQVPVDADISSLRHPDRRCGPAARIGTRSVRPAHRAPPAGGLRAHRGHLRQHLDQARRGTPRLGRPGPSRTAGQGRPDRRRRILADCAPGETGVLAIGGPAVFAGYVTDPAPAAPG